jgi:hypothetical protein
MNGFVAAHGHFPASKYSRGKWSPQTLILPFLEEQDVYDRVPFKDDTHDVDVPASERISAVVIPVYQCPSEVNTEATRDLEDVRKSSPLNYGVNMGDWFVWDPVAKKGGSGVFLPDGGTRPQDITDGLSKTLMLAEVKTLQPHYRNSGTPSDESIPTSPAQICTLQGSESRLFLPESGHVKWLEGRAHHIGFTTTFAPNTLVGCVDDFVLYDVDFNSWKEGKDPDVHKTYAAITARSHHPGIVQTATTDGAVQESTDDIDLMIWRALSTRNGGDL